MSQPVEKTASAQRIRAIFFLHVSVAGYFYTQKNAVLEAN